MRVRETWRTHLATAQTLYNIAQLATKDLGDDRVVSGDMLFPCQTGGDTGVESLEGWELRDLRLLGIAVAPLLQTRQEAREELVRVVLPIPVERGHSLNELDPEVSAHH